MAAASQFPCKRVSYGERDVPILMQNENGPCPLLALANVLLLRDDISIHADKAHISFSELTSLIAEWMLERNVLSETNAELRANQQQNITDCMALFPKLNRGLDVNVKFDSVEGLEYSEDLLLFDLLHVRLLHGWLVDPQERAAHGVLGHLSYNQAVEKVIEMSSPAQPTTAATPSARPPPPAVTPAPRAAPPSGGSQSFDDEEMQAALALSMQSHTSPPPSPPSLPSPPPSPPDLGATPGRMMGEAMVARDWLNVSASQLTYYGLEQLHRAVNDRELAVFFRNNHFSTLTKHDGELNLLATDRNPNPNPNPSLKPDPKPTRNPNLT